MPDHQTLQAKNGIAGSGDRLDDTSSSVRLSTGGAKAPRRADRNGVIRHRAPHVLQSLRASLGQHNLAQIAMAAAALCGLGLGVAAVGNDADNASTGHFEASRSAVEERASRSMERAPRAGAPAAPASEPEAAAVPPAQRAQPGPAAPAKPAPAKPAPAKPAPAKKQLPSGHLESGPVAGLDDVQMDNAKAIVWTGVDLKMPRRALVIAIATAMQESELLNRASEVLPESKQYPHQGTGWDHDSVGLFQQRTSAGWGSVEQLMDPAYASQAFYDALMQIPGWQDMALTDAAQAVQVSAFGWLYAQHEDRAQQVVDALTDVP